MIKFWNFNYFSPQDWEFIGDFWNRGGAIRQPKDYFFIFSLLSIIPLWLMGWRYFYKKDFRATLLAPIIWINNRQLARYKRNEERIVIKNLGSTTEKIAPKEKIDASIEQMKKEMQQKSKTSDILREKIKDKLKG